MEELLLLCGVAAVLPGTVIKAPFKKFYPIVNPTRYLKYRIKPVVVQSCPGDCVVIVESIIMAVMPAKAGIQYYR